MKTRRRAAVCAALAATVTVGLLGLGGSALGNETVTATWKNGVTFTSEDGSAKVSFLGRLYLDGAWLDGDAELDQSVGNLPDGTELRAARLVATGVLYGNVDFKTEYDFAGGMAKAKDMYVAVRQLPVLGKAQVGQFKEPFGLEQITSGRFVTFMERSLLNAFVPSRNVGLSLGSHSESIPLAWSVGIFRESDDFAKSSGDGDYSVTARVTAVPFKAKDSSTLLHLGIAASRRHPAGNEVSYGARPEHHLAPKLVSTDDIEADNVTLLGGEAALVSGPFSVQTEGVLAMVESQTAMDPTFSSYYVQASWFPTGEHRTYKASSGKFDRVFPRAHFDGAGGAGAWELAARLSNIDLNDGAVSGGQLTNVTVGANWYLNPNTRWMFNLVLADLDGGGNATVFGSRVQFDF